MLDKGKTWKMLVGNDSEIARAKNVHYKKLQLQGFKNNELLHNPEDMVHNYLSNTCQRLKKECYAEV